MKNGKIAESLVRMFVINWTASDLDGNLLNYAVLFSSDNGTTYDTLTFDHNQTWFNLSSNNLEDSDKYLIKVLVTDGVRTNESIMNQTFEIDNDLKIKNFTIVYGNNSESIFKISLNNSLSQAIGNITWEFNSGESVNEEVAKLANYQPITSSTETRKIVRNRNTSQDVEERIYLINGGLIVVKTDGSIHTKLFCL